MDKNQEFQNSVKTHGCVIIHRKKHMTTLTQNTLVIAPFNGLVVELDFFVMGRHNVVGTLDGRNFRSCLDPPIK
jgi:hypothetical protein